VITFPFQVQGSNLKTFHFRSTNILPPQFLIPKPLSMLTYLGVSFCDSPIGGSGINGKQIVIGKYERKRQHLWVKCTNTRKYKGAY
jgi:hypothetical protein